MTRRRWIILGVMVFLPVLLVTAAVFAVYKNQRALTQMALESVNSQFAGLLVIDDSHIAPFAQFPYISIDLQGVRFYESKDITREPIFETSDLYLGFDVLEVIRGHYNVKKIRVSSGFVDLVKNDQGELNLLQAIAMETEAGASNQAVSFKLKEIRVEDFVFSFSDTTMGQEVLAEVSQIRSSIGMNDTDVFLDVKTSMVLTVSKDRQPTFFQNKAIQLDWDIDYKVAEKLLTISPSRLAVQDGVFTVEGTVGVASELDMDLKIYGEKPDFSLFSAFAPTDVADALKRYKNEGQIYFLGTIRGRAGNGEMPSIAVEFGCENAFFVNTVAERRIDELSFSGFFTNGKEKSLRTSELRLQNFYAKPEEGVFQGQLVIRNFEDPFIKVNLNADLDLEFLGQFFEIEGLRRIRGQVLLDMDFDELIDLDMPADQIARLKEGLDSELQLKNLSFTLPGYPHAVTNANGYAVMDNGRIRLDFLRFKVAESDFEFSGELSDFPAVFHRRDVPVTAKLEAKSNRVAFSELLAFDSALVASTSEELTDFNVKLAFASTGKQLAYFENLPLGTFRIEDLSGKLKKYPHELHQFDVKIVVEPSRLVVEDFSGYIDTSDFQFSGILTNYDKWFSDVKTGKSRFDFNLTSKSLVVRDLLSYNGENYLPESYRDEVLRGFNLQGALDLNYDTTFQSADLMVNRLEGKFNVHPLKLESFSGRVKIDKGNILVEKLGGRMGKSEFEMDLAYFSGKDTVNKIRDNHLAIRAKALDLDALLNYDPYSKEPVNHADTFNIFELPFSHMKFTADIERLNYHTYWFEDLRAVLRTTPDHFLYVDTLHVRLADGSLAMNGYFNGSDSSNIYFHSTMVAEKLDIDRMMIKFDNFGQDVMINENLHGKVSGTIVSRFLVHPDLTPIVEKSEARMDLVVYDGSLVNFAPLRAMSSYFRDRNLNVVRFDTLQNTFDLKNGVLHIPKMNINSSLGFIEMSGRQSLDLNMDYFIRIPLGLVTQVGFRSLFGGRTREDVDPEQEDAIVFRDQNRRIRFVNLNIAGDPNNFRVSLGRDRGQ
ncbi:AsmA-like C-terminal region-containing protein [Lunatimonas lonarensis]|nr:AsmA-like C-terminal region-containing protein [Lunatimonas lonarensis]